MSRIGIDFGTTNSVIALEGAVLDQLESGVRSVVLPSVVAHLPTGVVLVGSHARRRRIIDAKNTVVAAKRLMGAHIRSHAARRYAEQYAVELREGPDGAVVLATRAGEHAPESIASTILSRLRDAIPEALRCGEAVVSIPSAFVEAQRQATLRAARDVGFGEARLVEEPVAAAQAYLAQAGERRPKIAAVYDLGGGTFDLSIVDCSSGELRVLAHGGDPYLGGDDLDLVLARGVAARVLAEHGWDLTSSPEVFDRLLVEAERAKTELTHASEVRIELAQVEPAGQLAGRHVNLTSDEVADAASAMVRRTFGICDQVLGAAGVRATDIDAVYLAGGSTRIPALRRDVAAFFGREPCGDLDPLSVVAIGASSMPR